MTELAQAMLKLKQGGPLLNSKDKGNEESIMSENNHTELAQALLKLQQGGPILAGKDSRGKHHRYASLASVLEAILARASACGLILQVNIKTSPQRITARSWLELASDPSQKTQGSELSVAMEEPQTNREGRPLVSPTQKLGGQITYLRRYAAMAAVGTAVSVDEEDLDDGPAEQQVQQGQRRPSPAPQQQQDNGDRVQKLRERLSALANEHGLDVVRRSILRPSGVTGHLRFATEEQLASIEKEVRAMENGE